MSLVTRGAPPLARPDRYQLLAALATAGLPVPELACYFGYDLASGSAPNRGSGGGSMAAVGTPTYQSAFPAPIGGYGVLFDAIAADGFAASDTGLGDVGVGEGLAVFAVIAGPSESAVTSIVNKRATTSSIGWELRVNANDTISAVVDDDVLTAVVVNAAGDVMDNAASYVAMRYIPGASGTLACWHDDSAGDNAAAAVDFGTLTNATALAAGFSPSRSAFGETGGLMHSLCVWVGADAALLTKAAADALWSAMGGS
jgi:hypothetical protein